MFCEIGLSVSNERVQIMCLGPNVAQLNVIFLDSNGNTGYSSGNFVIKISLL